MMSAAAQSRIDEEGYTVEFALLLKSLRYREGETVTMSLFFERKISRYTEHSSFPSMNPAKGMQFLTQMRQMVYHNLE